MLYLGFRLKCYYPSGNFELDYVLEKVKSFFECKGFLVSIKSEESAGEVLVSDHSGRALVKVELRRDSSGFSIRYAYFVSPGKIGLLGLALSLFGGGFFVVKDLKLREKLERVEREFWREMDSLFYCRL